MNILLVEDNDSIVEALQYAFKKEGYQAEAAGSVQEAEAAVNRRLPGLVVLDVNLPDGDGFGFYEVVLKERGIPTLFLTARDDEDDVVRGLTIGAEDYLTKPFSTRELMARVKRILLRYQKKNVIQVQDISYDLDRLEVRRRGETVELSGLETKLLHLLFVNVNRTVTRAILLDKIWEWTGNDVDDHTVTVYMRRLRQKLEDDVIITVKGVGYRIDAPYPMDGA